MIYLTSDLHFCHDRAFMYGPRKFKNIYEHDQAIIRNWNNMVTETDDMYIYVYVLEDLMLNDNEQSIEYIKKLKKQTSYHIRKS